MGFISVSINGQAGRYWSWHNALPESEWILVSTPQMKEFERLGSSGFFWHAASSSLCKIAIDKYRPAQQPWRWLTRDIIERRILGKVDALREWSSNREMRRLGIDTIECRGVAMALNPFNAYGSLLLMELLHPAETLRSVYENTDSIGKREIIDYLAESIGKVAMAGYYFSDLHLNNILVSGERKVWVDTHIRRLPQSQEKASALLNQSLSAKKMLGEENRKEIGLYLKSLLSWYQFS